MFFFPFCFPRIQFIAILKSFKSYIWTKELISKAWGPLYSAANLKNLYIAFITTQLFFPPYDLPVSLPAFRFLVEHGNLLLANCCFTSAFLCLLSLGKGAELSGRAHTLQVESLRCSPLLLWLKVLRWTLMWKTIAWWGPGEPLSVWILNWFL